MYFEAESNGKKYQLNVSETRTVWKIDLKEDSADWVHYDIPKSDYQYIDQTLSFIFKNSSYLVDVTGRGTDYTVYTRGAHSTVRIYNEEKILHESLKGGGSLGQSNSLNSGMPGKIVKVFVKAGDMVKEGDPLLIMEAMKMENEMRATGETKIKEVLVKPGDNVESGVVLISFEKAQA
ncbi:MAG: biotin/lipoyl-containing protein [Bdellovibrionales bacterium]